MAPKGYHVPSDEEWTKLTDFLGGEEKAGYNMKSKTGWKKDSNGSNESGFSGLPGGYRSAAGSFSDVGFRGHWWSATESSTSKAGNRFLNSVNGAVNRDYFYEDFGFSVRCLMD